ncbi:MAG: hypothetical protein HWN67_08370 [Candidatus Helarchaeota archaeon]|nr:hypothetical protein [Candidatus Helarchaeota archaeon]
MKLDYLGDILKRGFNKSYKNTIGLDILLTHVNLNGIKVDFSFWDISMQERLRFFRSSFYRGTSSVVILFDYSNPITISPFLTEIIDEMYNSIGPIPIFLIGLNSDDSSNNEYIEQISEEDYIFYFDFENKLNFQKEILGYLAEISLNMIQESSDLITTKIREQFQRYFDLKQQGHDNFYDVLNEMGLKIDDNSIKILNKYGLFTIDIITGSVIFESLMCENCENIENCQKKHVIPKKALCIVSDSFGWNNLFIEQDKLLILSKIFAIMEGDLPEHVLNQMKHVQKCPEIIQPLQLEPMIPEMPEPEEREIYINLTRSEIKQRLKVLKTQLWEGRIPASTYVKMQDLLNQKENEKELHDSEADESCLMLREAMLCELRRIKSLMLSS